MVTNPYNVKQSHEAAGGPTDAISKLAWCPDPSKYLLSAGSWDKTVRVWSVSHMGGVTTQPLVFFQQEAPVLTSCFNNEGRVLFAGGCEQKVKMYDLSLGASQKGQVIAAHDKPIHGSQWCEQHNVLLTVSWDGHLRIWDGKSSNPVFDHKGNKICAMDFKFPFLVVADITGNLLVWDMQKLTPTPAMTMVATAKHQIRDVAIFPDSNKPGTVVVEIAGRCCVQNFDRRTLDGKPDFSFKCHRVPAGPNGHEIIYSVNAADVNLKYNTLATAGSDGLLLLWDKDNKQRLKSFEPLGAPIVDVKFHPASSLLAFAASYDWHKGFDEVSIRNSPNKVYIHAMLDDDIKPRPKNSAAR